MVIALAAASVFATTNLDNMVVLVGLLAARPSSRRSVLIGYLVSNAFTLAFAAVAAFAAIGAPRGLERLLGLAPIAIGLLRLSSWRQNSDSAQRSHKRPAFPGGRGVCAFAAVTASSSDNLAAYIPLLAVSSTGQRAETLLVFAALSGIWCLLATFVVDQPEVMRILNVLGGRLAPLVLIALGFRALLSTSGWA